MLELKAGEIRKHGFLTVVRPAAQRLYVRESAALLLMRSMYRSLGDDADENTYFPDIIHAEDMNESGCVSPSMLIREQLVVPTKDGFKLTARATQLLSEAAHIQNVMDTEGLCAALDI